MGNVLIFETGDFQGHLNSTFKNLEYNGYILRACVECYR